MQWVQEQVPGADVRCLLLDLRSVASVQAFAEQFGRLGLPLTCLVCNAGINSDSQDRERQLTEDGFDELFQANFLGHFLLVKLLVKHLREGAPSRVFQVSSVAHRYAPAALDWEACRERREPFKSLYGASKLAQIHFARELHARLAADGVASHAYNPGGVRSDIWRDSGGLKRLVAAALMQSPDAAAVGLEAAILAPELQRGPSLYLNGYRGAGLCRVFEYLGPLAAGGRLVPSSPSPAAQDAALGRALWDLSERWMAEAELDRAFTE